MKLIQDDSQGIPIFWEPPNKVEAYTAIKDILNLTDAEIDEQIPILVSGEDSDAIIAKYAQIMSGAEEIEKDEEKKSYYTEKIESLEASQAEQDDLLMDIMMGRL